jgi:hypothetical protein
MQMIRKSFALAVMALVCAQPALAAAATAEEGDTGKGKKERKICKRYESTGSRMLWVKVCKSAAQWRADAEAAKEADGTVFMNENDRPRGERYSPF